MKILYIGNNLSTAQSLPTGISFLSQALREDGMEVVVASAKKNKVLRLLHMLTTLVQNSRSTDYVLIDTYSTSNFWYAYMVASLCRRFSLKYIPILHGGDLPKRLKKTPKACRELFGSSYINVAPSNYLMKVFKDHGFDNLKYIPNPLQLDSYPFVELVNVRPRLLWVRAFDEIYNPLMAIQVLEQLLRTFPDAALCMIGPDKDSTGELCRNYAKKKNLPVSFMGRMEKKDWIRHSAGYDLFINTSTIDNSPLSVIEAMALGFPVISTDVGGLPYLIKHRKNGLLVPADDVTRMSQAVEELIQHPAEARTMAENARRTVGAFDWEVVRKEWLKLLR